jgi:hypothetical protein
MDERTQRISLRAYEIWEKKGRPDGGHMQDWAEAEREIDAEMAREMAPRRVRTVRAK